MSHHKPDPNQSINLTINGQPVTVPEGTRILEAAEKVNVHIPTLCEHPDLCKRALCRICVVEVDGRGKLIAACANDVWEGANIVTNNLRLLNVRKTILELILANHPQDCLKCIRNNNCELQSLAAELAVRSSPFEATEAHEPPVIESETIVRDMSKCVKCARCVEACQEVQTIRAINTSCRSYEFNISAPYKQPLDESSCVFCGKCAAVCPVGAIYEHDQTSEVWDSLNDKDRHVIAQVFPETAAILEKELALPSGTVTTGRMTAAIRMLGFDQVFDAIVAANASDLELNSELKKRTKEKRLPMISGNSQGVIRFIKNFYPDLQANLAESASPRRILSDFIKSIYAGAEDLDESKITSVSFVPYIAQKYTQEKTENDFALTAAELARMIKLAGIDMCLLEPEPFDIVEMPQEEDDDAESPVIIHGFAEARKVMEAIRKGECDAKWVEIESFSYN